MDDDTRALLVLLRAFAPPAQARALLDRFGSAAAVLDAGPRAWTQAGLHEKCTALLARPDAGLLRADLDWLRGGRRRVVGWHDADYPALLRAIPDPPTAL